MSETVVLLHGFAGTHRTWDGVSRLLEAERYTPVALDLPGHGTAAAARPITIAAVVAAVAERAPTRFVLCGYSMGGRLALHAALGLGDRVTRLVLVSTSAGIADAAEREARRRDDEELAGRLERHGIEPFVTAWRELPLFRDDADAVHEFVAAEQRRGEPGGLAAALRGIGAGAHQALWDHLDELRMPVAVLAGERDAKYVELARRLAGALPHGELATVAGAGHRLPLEAPAAIAAACMGNAGAGILLRR